MDEAAIQAEIERRVREELSRQRGDADWGANLGRLRGSAATEKMWEGNPGAINSAPRENARVYGTVLAAQMLKGMLGTGMGDDGYGAPE